MDMAAMEVMVAYSPIWATITITTAGKGILVTDIIETQIIMALCLHVI